MGKNTQIQPGAKFNYWEVLEVLPKSSLLCQCICGVSKTVNKYFLTSGKSKSCGCQKELTRQSTNLERYGTAYASQTLEVKKKQQLKKIEQFPNTKRARIKKGAIFGNWLVLADSAFKTSVVKCKCLVCEKTVKNVQTYGLLNNKTTSCGCEFTDSWLDTRKEKSSQSRKGQIYIGQQFESWTVLEKATLHNRDAKHILCRCICGKEQKVDYGLLLYARVKSCSCKKEVYRKETNLEKYGVEHALMLPEFQEKVKQTNLKRYGVENPNQLPKFREKARQTNLDRYGVECPIQLPEIQEKARQTNLERYGVDNPSSLPEFQEKTKRTNLERHGVEYAVQLPENRNTLKEWCEANPHLGFTSKGEQEILTWIQTFYPNARKYKTEGNEIDIFIPEINLGVEYNGLYWHSEARSRIDKSYHLNKTTFFKEKSIRVIHIFEHEWRNSEHQVKSFVQSAIGKNTSKIGARKCSFTWIDSKEDKKEVRDFLNAYHIQGKCNFTYAIKVIHKNHLIGVATFGKHHRNSTDWVLSRFCTKQNYTIQGGLAKISKLAYSQLQQPLISWAHYRISDGNGYEKAGWEREELLKPDYFYHKQGRVISKQSRQKKAVSTPKGMTEKEHAKLDGLERVWDCGKIRYKYEDRKL